MQVILMILSRVVNKFLVFTILIVHQVSFVTVSNTNATTLAVLILVEKMLFVLLKIIEQAANAPMDSDPTLFLTLNVYLLRPAMQMSVIQQHFVKLKIADQYASAHQIILETRIQLVVACKSKETVLEATKTVLWIPSANKENVSTHVKLHVVQTLCVKLSKENQFAHVQLDLHHLLEMLRMDVFEN